MRKVHSSFVAVAVVFATFLPVLAGASTTPTKHLAAPGGRVTMSAKVKSAGWCVWSSSPKVSGFNASVRCKPGSVSRSATIGANSSTKAKDYLLTLKMIAKSTTVEHLSVIEAGVVPTAITIGVSYAPGSTVITIWPEVHGAGFGSPAPGTLTITMVDTATAIPHIKGYWTNEGSVAQPTVVWNVSTINQTEETLTLDTSAGSAWSGPSVATVSSSDLLDGYVGVSASFAGMPGFAGSLSSTVGL